MSETPNFEALYSQNVLFFLAAFVNLLHRFQDVMDFLMHIPVTFLFPFFATKDKGTK